MKKRWSALVATALTFPSLMGCVSAHDPVAILSEKDKATLIKNLNRDGIDKDTQNKLIDKLDKGHVLDSMKPNMRDKATVEQQSYIDKQGIAYNQTKRTYPDGSYQIERVSGGWSQCGSGYCNYYDRDVYYSDSLVTASYLADYTIVRGGKDYISEVDQERITTIVGVPDNIQLTIKYKTEGQVGSVPATAYLKFQKNTSGVYGTTYYLYLYVHLDTAYTSAW